MIDQPLLLVAILCGCVIVSQWLVDRTWLRLAGTAMLVIIVTAIVANAGLIPTASTAERPVPVYDGIFAYVAPMAIFWLVLRVDLRKVLGAGVPMLVLFTVGAVGTTAGVLAGLAIVGGNAFGDASAPLAGMFVGTYIGGSANFNAIALHYDVVREGTLYVAAVAVDAGMTAVWMVVTIVVPRMMRRRAAAGTVVQTVVVDEREADREAVDPTELAILLGAAAAALWASNASAQALAERGVQVPSMLILTSLALALAQIPFVARLRGPNLLGMFAVYLFLAVIGAFCDVAAVGELGRDGAILLLFVTVCLLVHGAITFGFAWVAKMDFDVAAIASQANIGGGTTALALARGLGRPQLVLPAILVGSLGTAAGTFVGFFVAGQLQ